MERLQQPRLYTILYVMKGDSILLIRKKRGFGKGYFNGAGGKVRADETLEAAAVREFREELCATPGPLEWRGALEFYNNGRLKMIVHVFVTDSYKGELCESDEAEPHWFRTDEIPYDKMWADDRHWFPLLLAGERFFGRFWFRDWATLTSYYVYKLREP